MWRAAVLAISAPGAAAAAAYSCDMVLAGEERRAVVLLESDAGSDDPSAVWTLTLTGTHVDPDWMLRHPAKTRAVEGHRADGPHADGNGGWRGDFAFMFSDSETIGILSVDYSRRANLSLHIAGPDHDYSEAYSGFCEVVL